MFWSTLGWIFKVSVVAIVAITGKNLFDEWVERIREEGREEVREEARRAIEELQKPEAEVRALDNQKNQLLSEIDVLSKRMANLHRLNSTIDQPRQELIRSVQAEIHGDLLQMLKTSISSQQQTAAAGFSAVQRTVSTLSDAHVRNMKSVTDMGKALGESIASSASAAANAADAASAIGYESTKAIRFLASRPSNSYHYTDNRQLTFRGGPTSSQDDSALVLRRS